VFTGTCRNRGAENKKRPEGGPVNSVVPAAIDEAAGSGPGSALLREGTYDIAARGGTVEDGRRRREVAGGGALPAEVEVEVDVELCRHCRAVAILLWLWVTIIHDCPGLTSDTGIR
jgi:hypothetical protein